MNIDIDPILAFPGSGLLENIIGGAASGIADDIFTSITGWILSSAFTIFGFAVNIAFSNDGITHGCAQDGSNIEACSRASFVFGTYQRSIVASASIAGIAFLFAVIKTIIQGDPGELARKVFLETPRIIFVSVFLLQGVMLLMLATDEIANYLTHPTLTEDRDAYLANFTIEELQSSGVEAPSFVVAILGVLLTIGSVFIWLLMMVRSLGISILVVLGPLIAALAVGGKNQTLNKLLSLLFAVITSKAVIMLVLSLGISVMLEVPFIEAGLEPPAVVAQAPAEPGETAIDEPDLASSTAANMQTAYQLATGAMLVFLAAFSPIVILQLLPDSVESYYAMGTVNRELQRVRQGTGRRASRAVRTGGRKLARR